MAQPNQVALREGEAMKLVLRPHPLAFAKYHTLTVIYIILAGLLPTLFAHVRSLSILISSSSIDLAIWWAVLLVPAIGAGLLWVSKQPLVYSVLVGLGGTVLTVEYGNESTILPVLLGSAGVAGIVLTELYRRGHRYFMTDQRLVLSKNFVTETTRELRYDRISDLIMSTGVLGKIFHFGSIIPVSQSGFGLGEDTAGAAAGVGTTRGRLVGGALVFGSKGASTPRSATYYSIYGVPGVKSVYNTLSELVHSYSEAPYLKRIEGLLREQSASKEKPESKPGELVKEKEQEPEAATQPAT